MKKSTEVAIAGLFVVLILLSVYLILAAPKEQGGFSLEQGGVLFVSNIAPPGGQLQLLGQRNSFVVSSEFAPTGSTSFMAEPLTLFNSVLVAQGKFVVTAAKSLDSKGNLLGCDTNDGNNLVNRKIDAAECDAIFGNSPHAVILVRLPDSTLPKSRVTVLENSVVIEPNSFSDVSRVSFLVLKTMYSDSQEIVDLINNIVGQVKR